MNLTNATAYDLELKEALVFQVEITDPKRNHTAPTTSFGELTCVTASRSEQAHGAGTFPGARPFRV